MSQSSSSVSQSEKQKRDQKVQMVSVKEDLQSLK